jgi:Ca2+-binding RTX toxin-like protein
MEGPVSEALHAPTRAIVAGVLLGMAAFVAPAGAATVDLTTGVLRYFSNESIANALTVSLTGGTYTLDDPAEVSMLLQPDALAAGCTAFDSNTVTCPAAAVASLDISTGQGDDFIELSGVTVPATLRGGTGVDTILGGAEDDTFVWNPGDSSDALDGGAGHDTLQFNGSNISENFTIRPDGSDFELLRDVGAVTMEVHDVEDLVLSTLGGLDNVTTTGLLATTQTIVDPTDDGQADTLTYDAAGLCPFFVGDAFDVLGRQPVHVANFTTLDTTNAVCGAILDLTAGVARYTATRLVVNALTVSLAGSNYTFHDTGEVAISFPRSTFEQGCANVNANTVTCPRAAVTSFDIDVSDGDDSVVLTGVADPAVVKGGTGNDTLVGGNAGDTFVWNPGNGSDTLDGGPGDDTLVFNGSNISEHFVIATNGEGFDLTRDVGAIHMTVQDTELLQLATLGGQDEVATTNLLTTTQMLTAGTDTSPDTLRVDGAGLCLTRQGDTFELAGRQPIQFADFTDVFTSNVLCRLDPCDGAVPTQGCTVNGVHHQPCQGTSGDDVIIGTKGADVILAGPGNDKVRGGAGDDLICGEEGDDVLIGGAGNDTLVGGPGKDRLRGNADNDTLLGGDDDDDLSGSSGSDILDGGTGDDRLKGGGGLDVLQGNVGNDALDGGGDEDFCTDADQPGPFLRCERD